MLSDSCHSCHSGSVTRDVSFSLCGPELERTFDTSEPNEVRARVRVLPQEAQFRNYQREQETYDEIQRRLPPLDPQDVKADVLLIFRVPGQPDLQ